MFDERFVFSAGRKPHGAEIILKSMSAVALLTGAGETMNMQRPAPDAADSEDILAVLNGETAAEIPLWLQEAQWDLVVELRGAGEIECRPHQEWVQTARCLGNEREMLRFLLPIQTTGDYRVHLALLEGGPVSITSLRLDTPGLEPRFIKAGAVRTVTAEAEEVRQDD